MSIRLSKKATISWASTFKEIGPDPHPMSNVEFRTLCTELKINDPRTAETLFGLNWRTCQRYWYDESAVPPPLARLLRLAARLRVNHDYLREHFVPLGHQDTRKKPRSVVSPAKP